MEHRLGPGLGRGDDETFDLAISLPPDVRLHWRDVTIPLRGAYGGQAGAAVTAVLFTIGQQVIGWHLGQSSVASSYGATGSVMVLLLWVYYSCQIVLFGAEFTRVWAARHGVQVKRKSLLRRIRAR